jgi:hypothetical protein
MESLGRASIRGVKFLAGILGLRDERSTSIEASK